MGRRAITVLVELSGGVAPEKTHLTLDTSLVVRASTRAPR